MTVASDDEGRACVVRQTPSAKLVYLVLQREGCLTQSALMERALLDRSTVRRAVESLEDCGVVSKEVNLQDARHRVYCAVE
ncbi:MarR family transcriptional regulator [Halobium palmae]|uniref:MarR family transcriptional regulator n=1 Tax=Halobium palmae TaxID=1776492 RepID=A0ABD5RX68_9EURY